MRPRERPWRHFTHPGAHAASFASFRPILHSYLFICGSSLSWIYVRYRASWQLPVSQFFSLTLCIIVTCRTADTAGRKRQNRTADGAAPIVSGFSWCQGTYETNLRMYYGSGTGGCRCLCARHMGCVHSLDGSTFMREMTSWPPSWKCDVKSKTRLRQPMHISWRTILTNFVWMRLKGWSLRLKSVVSRRRKRRRRRRRRRTTTTTTTTRWVHISSWSKTCDGCVVPRITQKN